MESSKRVNQHDPFVDQSFISKASKRSRSNSSARDRSISPNDHTMVDKIEGKCLTFTSLPSELLDSLFDSKIFVDIAEFDNNAFRSFGVLVKNKRYFTALKNAADIHYPRKEKMYVVPVSHPIITKASPSMVFREFAKSKIQGTNGIDYSKIKLGNLMVK